LRMSELHKNSNYFEVPGINPLNNLQLIINNYQRGSLQKSVSDCFCKGKP